MSKRTGKTTGKDTLVSVTPIPEVWGEGSEVFKPQYENDAGFDLPVSPAYFDSRGYKIVDHALIPTGVKVSIPKGYVGLILPRSSAAKDRCVNVIGGVIDSGYEGELFFQVHSVAVGGKRSVIHPTDRLAQIVVVPHLSFVREGSSGQRGDKSLGSTNSTVKSVSSAEDVFAEDGGIDWSDDGEE